MAPHNNINTTVLRNHVKKLAFCVTRCRSLLVSPHLQSIRIPVGALRPPGLSQPMTPATGGGSNRLLWTSVRKQMHHEEEQSNPGDEAQSTRRTEIWHAHRVQEVVPGTKYDGIIRGAVSTRIVTHPKGGNTPV